MWNAKSLPGVWTRVNLSISYSGNRNMDSFMECDQIGLFFNIDHFTVHTLLSSVLQCLDPMGKKKSSTVDEIFN